MTDSANRPPSNHPNERDGQTTAGAVPAPLVTVIVRTRDRPALLATALGSVRDQTYREIELLVINDGGEDVESLVAEYGQGLLKVRYHRLDPGRGRCAAANVGLDLASGECMIFLDDDDWFLPDHLAKLAAALGGEPTVGVAYTGVECVEADGDGGFRRVHVFNEDYDPIHLALQNFIPMHAALFRRSLITDGCRVDENLELYEDWDFWMQLSERTTFVHVEGISAVYRIGGAGGFGVAGNPATISRARQAFFDKWRGRWSAERFEGIIRYAMHEKDYRFLHGELDTRDRQLGEARHAHAVLEQQANDFRQQLEELQDRLDEGVRREAELKQAVAYWSDRVHQLEHSRSWRITGPLRTIRRRLLAVQDGAGARLALVRRYLALSYEVLRAEGLGRLLQRIRRKTRPRLRPAAIRTGAPVRVAAHWQALELPRAARPRVSVIIPVHNQHLHTFTCLRSVVEAHNDAPFEVIVVDDHSTDETAAMLATMDGVVACRNTGTQGFVHACNLGAASARGAHLVFLNNDTAVADHWLDRLLETFERIPEAGLIGVRLIYPDGRLQEAGGIVWRDGSAWNYGRDDDPERPEYNYMRDVDYCSGACLAVERSLFERVHGFSDAFAPAYYEDVDLAFKVRAEGRRVLYQPAVTIVHFEGASAGQHLASGMKRFQVRNQARLHERWERELSTHRVNGIEPELEVHRTARGRVLVIDSTVPKPDRDSGSLRMSRLLELTQGLGYQVSFAGTDLQHGGQYGSALQQLGVEVLYSPHVSSLEQYLADNGARFDLVVLSRVSVAARLLAITRKCAPRARVVFDTVDLRFVREARFAELQGGSLLGKAAATGESEELALVQAADVTLVVSTTEQALLSKHLPAAPVHVVSNIFDIRQPTPGYQGREGILFIGSFNHPPNADAAMFLVREVLPWVHRTLGPVPTWIVGDDPPAKIRALGTDSVVVTGHVPDLAAYLDRSRLSVAPLRYGAGVKGKVNISMACGLPVVATPVAAEGMHLTHGHDALIADGAQDFAAAVAALYQDRQLWHRLSLNGLENIRTYFSAAVARRALEQILDAGSPIPNPANIQD